MQWNEIWSAFMHYHPASDYLPSCWRYFWWHDWNHIQRRSWLQSSRGGVYLRKNIHKSIFIFHFCLIFKKMITCFKSEFSTNIPPPPNSHAADHIIAHFTLFNRLLYVSVCTSSFRVQLHCILIFHLKYINIPRAPCDYIVVVFSFAPHDSQK